VRGPNYWPLQTQNAQSAGAVCEMEIWRWRRAGHENDAGASQVPLAMCIADYRKQNGSSDPRTGWYLASRLEAQLFIHMKVVLKAKEQKLQV
jgi:hypothetical protein